MGTRVSKIDDLVSVQERDSERDLRNQLSHFSLPHIKKDIYGTGTLLPMASLLNSVTPL